MQKKNKRINIRDDSYVFELPIRRGQRSLPVVDRMDKKSDRVLLKK